MRKSNAEKQADILNFLNRRRLTDALASDWGEDIDGYVSAAVAISSLLNSRLLGALRRLNLPELKIDFNPLHDNPLLGAWFPRHSFYCSELYRYINPQERQLTTALCRFMSETQNRDVCRAFLCALGVDCRNFTMPDSACEVRIHPEEGNKSKRIDNLISWFENGRRRVLCLEVKFDYDLHNDLKEYEAFVDRHYPGADSCFKVISQYEVDISAYPRWKNLLWCEVLKKWERNIALLPPNAVDEDFRRYRSSLWRKIYNLQECQS